MIDGAIFGRRLLRTRTQPSHIASRRDEPDNQSCVTLEARFARNPIAAHFLTLASRELPDGQSVVLRASNGFEA